MARFHRLSVLLAVLVAAAGAVRTRVPGAADHGVAGRRSGPEPNASFRPPAPAAEATADERSARSGGAAAPERGARFAPADSRWPGVAPLAVLADAVDGLACGRTVSAGAQRRAVGGLTPAAPSVPRAPPAAHSA